MQTNSFVHLLIGLMMLMNFEAPAQQGLPPEGSAPKDIVLPAKTTFVLENGLLTTLVPYGTVPKVTIRLVVEMGSINERANEVWLSSLVGDYLEEGTVTRTARQVAEEAARMGGEVGVGVGDDLMTIEGSVLSEFGPGMVGLLADVIRNPRFPESELERLKNDRIRDLNIQKADPNALATELFRALMYPDHPYGRVFPSEQMIQGYTTVQVRNFYASNVGAGRTRLYVAGKFDASQMEQAIRDAFSTWPRGPERVPNVPAPETRRAVHIIDRPGAPQSTTYIGLPTIDPSAPEYRQLLVMNALLGGSFMSRVTSNIREDKGYTYSPGSMVSTRYRNAYWTQFASITSDVTGPALKEIFHEIDRLQSEPPSQDELKGIQNYVAGVFVLRNSSPSGIINLLSFNDFHGLPDTYLTDYVKTVYAVTPKEIQQLAMRYLREDEMQIVIAGDKKKIEKQVAQFGRSGG
jgi:predicted Zn-dependent peptidase